MLTDINIHEYSNNNDLRNVEDTKTKRIKGITFNISKILIISLFLIFSTLILTYYSIEKFLNNNYERFLDNKNIVGTFNEGLPTGFYYLNNNAKGPITVDRKLDDGTKKDFYQILPNDYFNNLNENENNNNNTKIAIIMFANRVNVNSIYENSLSEVYQYSNIHNYTLKYYTSVYNKEKDIMYMKLSSILETLTEGLKYKSFDWVFWLDSDTILSNPTIKLESFLPIDENIHFIAAADSNGLNAGIFFLRVNSWSYNFIIDALSYPDYHKDEFLRFDEQTAMNNILSNKNATEHYVIVPNNWFNQYSGGRHKGDFILHFPGTDDKDIKAKNIRKTINLEWYNTKTNEDMREEVLRYYNISRSSQYYNGLFTYRHYDKTIVDHLINLYEFTKKYIKI